MFKWNLFRFRTEEDTKLVLTGPGVGADGSVFTSIDVSSKSPSEQADRVLGDVSVSN